VHSTQSVWRKCRCCQDVWSTILVNSICRLPVWLPYRQGESEITLLTQLHRHLHGSKDCVLVTLRQALFMSFISHSVDRGPPCRPSLPPSYFDCAGNVRLSHVQWYRRFIGISLRSASVPYATLPWPGFKRAFEGGSYMHHERDLSKVPQGSAESALML